MCYKWTINQYRFLSCHYRSSQLSPMRQHTCARKWTYAWYLLSHGGWITYEPACEIEAPRTTMSPSHRHCTVKKMQPACRCRRDCQRASRPLAAVRNWIKKIELYCPFWEADWNACDCISASFRGRSFQVAFASSRSFADGKQMISWNSSLHSVSCLNDH